MRQAPHRVFVVNETLRRSETGMLERTLDLSPALQFGQLVHLLPAGQPPADPGAVVTQIEQGLTSFTANDYLLLVGNPVAIGCAVALAHMRTQGTVKVLRWIPRERRYQELIVPLPSLIKEEAV